MTARAVKFWGVIGIVAVVLLTSSGCQKLSVGYLKGNHHFARGNTHFSESLYRKAIEEYEKALQYNPNLVEAYRFLGESYKSLYKPGDESEENLQRAKKALENLRKALEFEPTNIELVHSLGDMYDKMGRFEEAEEMFLKVLELEPTTMENYYVVAGFYNRYASENKELKRKAEEMYLRRLELDPESPQGYAYLAQFYDNIRPIPDFDRAYEMHMKILQLKPDDALTWYTVGVNRFQKAYRLQNLLSLEERKKLADESEKALKKALELDSSFPDTYAYINLLYRNINANIYPERSERYVREADRWLERFQEVRKRQAERRRLEEELKRGREIR
ncbi:MAG: tetratricopeptide repeat protein [Candidatus Aminicenantales bacterium]